MKNRRRLHSLSVGMVMLLTCVSALSSVLWADDLDQQLLKSLEEDQQTESVDKIIGRLLDNTSRAQSRVADSKIDDVTQSVQQQILDDIDALLKQSSPPADPPPASSSEQPSPQTDQSTSSESQESVGESAQDQPAEGNRSPDPNAESRESDERTSQAEGTSAMEERRLGLATAVWGHLPPKVREQMRSAFSETYLPEYDDLVRRYYEALAARRHQEERGGKE